MAKAMKENNYVKGYFYTPNGEMTFLGDLFTSSNDIVIYDIRENNVKTPIGLIKNYGACNVTSFRTFSLNDYDKSYFNTFTYNDTTYTRNLLLSIKDCSCNEEIDTSFMISKTESLIDLTYRHFNAIWALKDNDNNLYKDNEIISGYIKKGDDETIYLSENTKEIYSNYTNSQNVTFNYQKIYL